MLRQGPAARFGGSTHLYIRMYVLRDLRGRRAEGPLPELRRRPGRAPAAAGEPAREVPAVDGTDPQAGRLRERLTARRRHRRRLPASVTTSRSVRASPQAASPSRGARRSRRARESRR
ncbi:hypothetical protein BCPG_02087 [Burkholderia cenocepacia PC184]|nr:hypothetical protein BCPG_02087 [Burkholderia cenocepacia PC184]